MSDYIFAVILLLLAVGGVVVRKTYYALPTKELKRRAEHHDTVAAKLYPAVAHGSSLRGLLWIVIALSSAGGFVLLSRIAPVWLSLIAVVLLLWTSFSWLPSSRGTRIGQTLTNAVTPVITWLLNYIHRPLSRTTDFASKRYTAEKHTGLFEREDLMKLIDHQQHQSDSRFTEEELEIAHRALSFGDFTVGNIMVPRKNIKTVNASDTVGPILIDELHKSGEDFVLVRESEDGDFVGSLAFKKLDLHRSGQVKDFMEADIAYLHEDDLLSSALHAFFSTNHQLFIVIDNHEDYIGIITIENVLRQLMGHLPGDDFDKYADKAAVVSHHKQKKEVAVQESVASEVDDVEDVDEEVETPEETDEPKSIPDQHIDEEIDMSQEESVPHEKHKSHSKKEKTDETPVKTDEKMVE